MSESSRRADGPTAFLVKRLLRQFGYVRRMEKELGFAKGEARRLEGENARLTRETAEWRRFAPPGHFYCPLPSLKEVEEAFARGSAGPPLLGIDLNEAGQFKLLETFPRYYKDAAFPENAAAGARFHLNNGAYGHHDALMLYCMLRHLRPRRVVEIGSGLSSALMLDTNDTAFAGAMELTFIDPDMSRLRPLLKPQDESRVRLLEQRVQDVPPEKIGGLLEANDVLFVDSSHVSKIGSDVNHLFFHVLPALRAGVHIHIHDVSFDLEYPREWLAEGRAWNELYLLRAFLMYNTAFEPVLWTSWLKHHRRAWLLENMPLCARDDGGQLWLRKV